MSQLKIWNCLMIVKISPKFQNAIKLSNLISAVNYSINKSLWTNSMALRSVMKVSSWKRLSKKENFHLQWETHLFNLNSQYKWNSFKIYPKSTFLNFRRKEKICLRKRNKNWMLFRFLNSAQLLQDSNQTISTS